MTDRGQFLDRDVPMDARMASMRSAQLAQSPCDHAHDDHVHHGSHGHGHSHSHATIGGVSIELVCACLATVCLVSGWLLSVFAPAPSYWPLAFYIATYGLTGWFMFSEAWQRIRVGKFEIDSLMLLAAAGAAYLDKWAEGGLLLCLFSIGHALESFAMGRAKRAIEALGELTPTTALVLRAGNWTEVPVEQLCVGELVMVKPSERISADGFVVEGQGGVDQASVTGESLPAEKRPVDDIAYASLHPEQLAAEHRVYAGTINGANALRVQVTRSSADNTLSRIIQLVSEAETRVSPTQTLTRRIETYFVPAVLAFDCLLLFAWLVIDEPFTSSLYRAMAVLVAASPCALAIATPSAVLSGIARAARGGVLVKGGGPLESLGAIKVIAFDKTGTLTMGKPRLTDVVPLRNISREHLLAVAVAVEQTSDHPLAEAIVRDARVELGDRDVPRAEQTQDLVGRGIQSMVDNKRVLIGKASLFEEDGYRLPSEASTAVARLTTMGRTTMIVQHGDVVLGVLGLMDTERSEARSVVSQLKRLGVERIVMLSGDNQLSVQAMASSLGITEAHGDLMPEDKVRAIERFTARGGVAMVGDGVNDAPALAGATVGIVMGAAGSDVALETADVALMADDLRHLPFAVGLSRQTRTIVRQNLWISLGMVAFLVPAAAMGLPLGPAVVLHEGSTLLVVFNALRLLAYRAPA